MARPAAGSRSVPRPGARARPGCWTRCRTCSARPTTRPGSSPRTRCCATWPAAPRRPDRPHRPGHGGAGPGGPGAEGRRPGGAPGLAAAAAPVRRPGARARARGDAGLPAARGPGPRSRPGSGTGPGWRASGPGRSSARAGGRPAGGGRQPWTPPRLTGGCGRCPASASGPRPRPGSGPAATPDAVSVGDYHLPGRRLGAGRAARSTTPGMLELLAPYAGHRYRAARLVELSGVRPPRRGPRIPVRDYRSLLTARSGRGTPARARPRSPLRVGPMSDDAPSAGASRARPPCAGRWPGPGTARPSTRPRRPCCCTPAATHLDDLLGYAAPGPGRRAGRGRAARRHHLLAQGLHPADPAVPGPLPLLHVRHRAGPAGQRRTCRRTRCSRSPGRAPRSAARRRCSPSATGPRTAGPQAREWLDAHGYDDTLAYVRAMAIRVLEETGLLPHLNPGVLTWTDFQRLKPVAPSMGMMLETTATPAVRPSRAARTSARPDKDPAVRLRVLEDAGRSQRPVHHRHPDRHRRDAAPSGPSRSSRSAGSPGSTAASRKSSSRTSAPSRTPRCARMPDAELRRPGRDDRGGPAGARPARADPGAAEPDRRRVRS